MLCNTQTTGYVVIEVVRITRCPILHGPPLIDTNIGLNVLFIVEVPPSAAILFLYRFVHFDLRQFQVHCY